MFETGSGHLESKAVGHVLQHPSHDVRDLLVTRDSSSRLVDHTAGKVEFLDGEEPLGIVVFIPDTLDARFE
jgi:hypothetical protein